MRRSAKNNDEADRTEQLVFTNIPRYFMHAFILALAVYPMTSSGMFTLRSLESDLGSFVVRVGGHHRHVQKDIRTHLTCMENYSRTLLEATRRGSNARPSQLTHTREVMLVDKHR